MTAAFLVIIVCGVCALLYGLVSSRQALAADAGTARMQEISTVLREISRAYLNRQYVIITIVGAVAGVFLGFVLGVDVAIGFLVGSILSGAAAYIGMNASVRSNLRVTQASRNGLTAGLGLALRVGAMTGLPVVGLALLGVTSCYAILRDTLPGPDLRAVLEPLVGLSFGASLISLFARLGGGIFAKGADVGADFVGKVELGIPEDDPRNPAVIADNVGDNVGDCAGMAADLFETYVVTVVVTMLLAASLFTGATRDRVLMLPLGIGAVGIPASIVGSYFVRPGADNGIAKTLYRGLLVTGGLSVIGVAIVIDWFVGCTTPLVQSGATSITGFDLLVCALIGVALTAAVVVINVYYTSSDCRPVRSIAGASTTGHGTNVIQGLAIAMEATTAPVIVIVIAIILSFLMAGLFGIAIAATTMLAPAGLIMALDAFGPVVDNAGGIAEMADLASNVRVTTDTLDAVGNTTKAVTKGYSIGSAGLASPVLFAAYTQELRHDFPFLHVTFLLADPYVVIGLFIGGLLPYLFGAMGMSAVGRAAGTVVVEVRRQFRELPGIIEGTSKPEYGRVVDMLTQRAVRAMVVPSLLPVLAPALFWLMIWGIGGDAHAFAALGAMLLGTIVTGLFVAISMTSGGSAWTNAEKYIEAGHYGGKGSDAHKAAVTGDAVGDPYKDTAGPAVNPMIRIISIVALLLLAVLGNWLH